MSIWIAYGRNRGKADGLSAQPDGTYMVIRHRLIMLEIEGLACTYQQVQVHHVELRNFRRKDTHHTRSWKINRGSDEALLVIID